VDLLEHRRLDLEIAAVQQALAQSLDGDGPVAYDIAGLGARHQVEIAAADPGLGVGQAVPLVGQRTAGAAFGVPVGDATGEIAEELVAEIRSAAERVKGIWDVRWEFHTVRGDPYSGLVTAADELKADAVVVGASESAGHRIIGSVAVRLVKAGRWPVTVVP
jgi:nucleotide-binding universal stress UspA family protein